MLALSLETHLRTILRAREREREGRDTMERRALFPARMMCVRHTVHMVPILFRVTQLADTVRVITCGYTTDVTPAAV